MLNSLLVFFAALAFIVFGYVSLLRIIWQQQSSDGFISNLLAGLRQPQPLIIALGSSGIFVSLPATSLLLFWGWGPALLWLSVFHLLVETIINMRLADNRHQVSLSATLAARHSSVNFIAPDLKLVWELMLVLIAAVVLTQLALMLDQQAGLIWALLGLIPAYLVISRAPQFVPSLARHILAGLFLATGLLMADSLGVAVYGSWRPFGDAVNWLVLENSSIAVLALLIAVLMLRPHPAVRVQLATLGGYLLVGVISLMLVWLIWLQPGIDAPIHSESVRNAELPPFMAVNLLLFGSLLLIVLRSLNHTATDKTNPSSSSAILSNGQMQSLLVWCFSALLVMALAAALGIGAWKTHYVDWSWDLDLLRHFELALNSSFELAAKQNDIGSLAHSAFTVSVCLLGLNLLLGLIQGFALTRTRPSASDTPKSYLINSSGVRIGLVFILACYFLQRGIGIQIWLLCGALGWLVLCDFLLALSQSNTDEKNDKSGNALIFNLLCLILILGGLMQMLWLVLQTVPSSQWLLLVSLPIVVVLAVNRWWRMLGPLIAPFASLREPKSLD